MQSDSQATHLRFETFELDLRTYELRNNGQKVHLQDQPAKVLTILASHRGELVTRVEIQKALWADDEFVEFEHGINTAIKKIREALGDSPDQPRLIETLPKKGYRFLARVEMSRADIAETPAPLSSAGNGTSPHRTLEQGSRAEVEPITALSEAEMEDLFALPLAPASARGLFMLIQVGYLAMYCVVLYKMEVLENVVKAAGVPTVWVTLPLILIMCSIAVRIYLMSAVGWNHPAAGRKFHKLFPAVLVLDAIWAASPLLAIPPLGIALAGVAGLAYAGVAGLAYLPFAQRTLVRCLYQTKKK